MKRIPEPVSVSPDGKITKKGDKPTITAARWRQAQRAGDALCKTLTEDLERAVGEADQMCAMKARIAELEQALQSAKYAEEQAKDSERRAVIALERMREAQKKALRILAGESKTSGTKDPDYGF